MEETQQDGWITRRAAHWEQQNKKKYSFAFPLDWFNEVRTFLTQALPALEIDRTKLNMVDESARINVKATQKELDRLTDFFMSKSSLPLWSRRKDLDDLTTERKTIDEVSSEFNIPISKLWNI